VTGEETGCHGEDDEFICVLRRRKKKQSYAHRVVTFGLPPPPHHHHHYTHTPLHQPSVPISINDVCSGGACCLSESLRSERRRDAEGFGPEETRLRLMEGCGDPESRHNTAYRTPLMSWTRRSMRRDAVFTVFTHEPLLQLD